MFVVCSLPLYSQKRLLEVVYNKDSVIINEKKISLLELDNFEKSENPYANPSDIDQMPIYKGCEQLYSRQARLVCMKNNIFKSIFKNVKYPKEAILKGEQGSVIVHYVVEKDGTVLPNVIIYSNESLKKATLVGVREWLKEIKEYRATPAYVKNEAVRYTDFLIFPFRLEAGGNSIFKTQNEYNSTTDKERTKKIIPITEYPKNK